MPLTEALPGSRVELGEGRPLLSVRDLSLSFGGVRALVGISFDVRASELFAVIGSNGAGKTSLLNCISGAYRPQQGEVELLGASVSRSSPAQVAGAGIARTFQNIALLENQTVLDNLMLGRHLHIRYGPLAALAWFGPARREETRHRAVVERIVELLEIERYRKQPVGALSVGIKKRVELGRALAMEPRLVLLDEPVAGMSLEEAKDMARVIDEIRRELALAMILVEHNMAFVMDLADRVLVLDFGTAVASGRPGEVQQDPRVIEAYLGQGEGDAGSQREMGDG